MDCVKNLTSCAGCTRKHARCHWRDVTREELGSLDMSMEGSYSLGDDGDGYGYTNGHDDSDDDDDSNPLEDLEALEEQEEGLRNARELSRLGWEESIKSNVPGSGEAQTEHQRAPVNGEATDRAQHGSPPGVSPRTHQRSVNTTGLSVEQTPAAPVVPHRLDTTNASPGAAKFASPIVAPPATQEDYRPSFGGFRAVNGVGGWRE